MEIRVPPMEMQSKKVTTILIADDHPLVRDGLRKHLQAEKDLSLIGEVGNGREVVLAVETLRPDVVIMEIAMPELNGIEATRMVVQRSPSTRILIFSAYYTLEHCYRALQAGARGYILKESAGQEILAGVRAIARGEIYFGTGVADPRRINGQGHARLLESPINSLSERELEIFLMVVDGGSSREIAQRLSLSPKSIDTYRRRVMTKLGVTDRSSLVRFAVQHSFTPPGASIQ